MKWCNIYNTWDESSVRREGGGGGMPPTSLQPESREPSTLPLMVWYKEATFPPPTLGPALLTRYGSLLPAHLHDSSLCKLIHFKVGLDGAENLCWHTVWFRMD